MSKLPEIRQETARKDSSLANLGGFRVVSLGCLQYQGLLGPFLWAVVVKDLFSSCM